MIIDEMKTTCDILETNGQMEGGYIRNIDIWSQVLVVSEVAHTDISDFKNFSST